MPTIAGDAASCSDSATGNAMSKEIKVKQMKAYEAWIIQGQQVAKE